MKYIDYCVWSSAVQEIVKLHTVFGVGQAVPSDPTLRASDNAITIAFGCNSNHRAQSMKAALQTTNICDVLGNTLNDDCLIKKYFTFKVSSWSCVRSFI